MITALSSSAAFSGELISSRVSHDNGMYNVSIKMQIQAPTDKVYALFTDFNYRSRLNDNIRNSDLIEEEPPDYIVVLETHNYVLFFCVDLHQTQKVSELGDGYIIVEDIKGQSDFIYAISRWHIYTHSQSTRVTFSSELKPDFWLPPLFSAWLFKKRLIEETTTMIERLERLATHEQ